MTAYNPGWNAPSVKISRRKLPLDALVRRACFSLNWRPVSKAAGCQWHDGKTKRDPLAEIDAIAERYHVRLTQIGLGHWRAEGPRQTLAEFHGSDTEAGSAEARARALFSVICMVYIGAGDIDIGDILLESSSGPGKVTDVDQDGFPILDDGTRVLWFIRQDGYRFDPTGEGEL